VERGFREQQISKDTWQNTQASTSTSVPIVLVNLAMRLVGNIMSGHAH